MLTLRLAVLAVLSFACSLGAVAQSERSGATSTEKDTARKAAARKLEFAQKPWTGDFDGMFERRVLRVYIPYSRSLYFIDKGRERGIAAEFVRDFERWINKKYAKTLAKRPLTVALIAATRDRLIPGLRDGLADIAVGNLTVTDERRKVVDFVAPDSKLVNTEIVVTGPASPAIGKLDDLAGKTIHVRRSSSYFDSLTAINARFKAANKPEIRLVLVPDALEDEDMMEMTNAGLLTAIVVDDWKAKMWAQVLPKVVVHENVAVHEPGLRGWAIRKGSPKLTAELQDFYTNWIKKEGMIPYRQRQYFATIKMLNDPMQKTEYGRYQQTSALFVKYGNQYGFDPLMLAAQGFQESGLDQDRRSPVGAIGVMQLMPATGQALAVGDVHALEPNINAGAKYLDQLMTKYFADAKFDDLNRTLFAFASYNAGPGNIAKFRREAEARGLDPNIWFNNVENVTAERIGIETTTYVRNIFKYYVSYKLANDARARAEEARKEIAPPKN